MGSYCTRGKVEDEWDRVNSKHPPSNEGSRRRLVALACLSIVLKLLRTVLLVSSTQSRHDATTLAEQSGALAASRPLRGRGVMLSRHHPRTADRHATAGVVESSLAAVLGPESRHDYTVFRQTTETLS
jgi:hypothetical protein